jgi:hypothetical protein
MTLHFLVVHPPESCWVSLRNTRLRWAHSCPQWEPLTKVQIPTMCLCVLEVGG